MSGVSEIRGTGSHGAPRGPRELPSSPQSNLSQTRLSSRHHPENQVQSCTPACSFCCDLPSQRSAAEPMLSIKCFKCRPFPHSQLDKAIFHKFKLEHTTKRTTSSSSSTSFSSSRRKIVRRSLTGIESSGPISSTCKAAWAASASGRIWRSFLNEKAE